MSTLRITLQNVPKVLSLLALSMLLAIPSAQIKGEELDDADLLFESVQMAYNPNQAAEAPVQEELELPPVLEEAAEEVSEEAVENLSAPEPVGQISRTISVEAEAGDAADNEKIVQENDSQFANRLSELEAPELAEQTMPAEEDGLILQEEPVLQAAAEESLEPSVKPEPAVIPVQAINPPLEANVQTNNLTSQQNGPVIRTAQTMPQVGNSLDIDADQQLPPEEETASIGPFQVYRESEEISVVAKRSMLMRTRYNLIRTAIVDPAICDIVQFTPREISIIGRSVGSTHVTFWFEDGTFKPITFVVNTLPDPSLRDRRAEQFKILEEQIAKMFPNSKITLLLLANKLIVRGQARSPEEVMEIMRILREDTSHNSDYSNGNRAVNLSNETGFDNSDLIIVNQIRVPGVQQVALKVKLADLSRTNGSSSGVDFSLSFNGDKILVESLMGAFAGGGGLISYNSANVKIGIDYLIGEGVVRQMSESTLVTMSGTSASLSTGGEIPVPTVTGVDGASAVSTSFRPYGTVINFLPIVMDKDLIRLKISSEFSALGKDGNEISGVPNLDSRTLNSEIQMREGQTFALGTTVEDNYSAQNRSNIPVFSNILGHKSKSRGEREMVILVSPELVSPMAPDQVPPLPGFDVTEPTNAQFHILGRMEGTPTRDYRSTVWPSLRNRYLSGGSAIISGPYGH